MTVNEDQAETRDEANRDGLAAMAILAMTVVFIVVVLVFLIN